MEKVLTVCGVIRICGLDPVDTDRCFGSGQLPKYQLVRHGLPDVQVATTEALVAILQFDCTTSREISSRIEPLVAAGSLTLRQKEIALQEEMIKRFRTPGANFHSFSPRNGWDPIHVRVALDEVPLVYYGDKGQNSFQKGDFLLVQNTALEGLAPFIRGPVA